MRIALVAALFFAGCASTLPPPPPPPPPPPMPTPEVVHRLLGEAHELIAHDRALANELPDPTGRARAQGEVGFLADDLEGIAREYPTQDSGLLDELVDRLARVTTRAALLHETLRAATNHLSALSPSPDTTDPPR